MRGKEGRRAERGEKRRRVEGVEREGLKERGGRMVKLKKCGEELKGKGRNEGKKEKGKGV